MLRKAKSLVVALLCTPKFFVIFDMAFFRGRIGVQGRNGFKS
jgi:hypothetical protein